MDKAIVIGVVAALLLGAVFVSAQISESAPVIEEPAQDTAPQECGPGSCGGTCGGNCGIPSCGCGR